MSLKLSTIRSRLATSITSMADGLKESYLPYDAFGRTPNSIAHKAFAVGIGGTSANDERQRTTVGALCSTDIDIKMAYRIRPLAQLPDIDSTMDLENDIIIKLLDRTNTTQYADGFHLKFTNVSRQLTDSGEYMISTIQFESIHYIPLN